MSDRIKMVQKLLLDLDNENYCSSSTPNTKTGLPVGGLLVAVYAGGKKLGVDYYPLRLASKLLDEKTASLSLCISDWKFANVDISNLDELKVLRYI